MAGVSATKKPTVEGKLFLFKLAIGDQSPQKIGAITTTVHAEAWQQRGATKPKRTAWKETWKKSSSQRGRFEPKRKESNFEGWAIKARAC